MRCPGLSELPQPGQEKAGWPWTEESPRQSDIMLDHRPWPPISIVTISYNQGQFIETAIRSVLLQAYPNLEYIIMDGGSTDGSIEVIKKYRAYLACWSSGPDGGPANALNDGFARCKGEICGYINSDDFLLPGALWKIVKAFTEHIEVDIIYGNGFFADAEGRLKRPIYSDHWGLTRYAYGATMVMQQATFFKRTVFERTTGFNPNNATSWDGELLIDMALAGARFWQIRDFLGAFRFHKNSITGSGRLQAAYVKDYRRLFQKIMKREPSTADRLIVAPIYRLLKHMNRLVIARRASPNLHSIRSR